MNSSGRHWHSMVIASISTELSSAARRKVSRTRAYRCAPKFWPATAGTANAMAITGRNKACITRPPTRSEEHTSELQSHVNLVCRLLLEKKKNIEKTVQWSTKKKKHIK